MNTARIILGIETSCDDTAAAVVTSDGAILSSVVLGQTEIHAAFGGIVPEIAARAHTEKADIAVEQALIRANVTFDGLDAIAVTAGPGLIGGLLSGVMTARGIAAGSGLRVLPVNHLAGHALTPRLTDRVDFPYLILLVSGGHCQFLLVESADRFTRLGGTIDDAPGEAFDKAARILGLPQPGGPAIQDAAEHGSAGRFDLPRPLLGRDGSDLSFSGLKTALLRARDSVADDLGRLSRQDQVDLAADFQTAVADVLTEKSRRAIRSAQASDRPIDVFAVAGGVAANTEIRAGLETVCAKEGIAFVAPPMSLCTDNAAMIAWAAIEQFDSLSSDGNVFPVKPRWPLDTRQPAMLGSGKRGAKA